MAHAGVVLLHIRAKDATAGIILVCVSTLCVCLLASGWFSTPGLGSCLYRVIFFNKEAGKSLCYKLITTMITRRDLRCLLFPISKRFLLPCMDHTIKAWVPVKCTIRLCSLLIFQSH